MLLQLQSSCKNPQFSNHVIQIIFQEDNSIHIQGMLYSQSGWQLDLSNDVVIDKDTLRLENCISDMSVPVDLQDKTLTPDSIVIINPNYEGEAPAIPKHWEAEFDDTRLPCRKSYQCANWSVICYTV